MSDYGSSKPAEELNNPPTGPAPSAKVEKPHVPNDLILHFDMGPDASFAMAEKKAEALLNLYYLDIPYRYRLDSHMVIMNTTSGHQISGYKFTVKAWKYISYDQDW